MTKYTTVNEAYLETVRRLIYHPEFRSSPRGQPIREILYDQFTVESPTSSPIVTRDRERNEKILAYTEAEIKLYESGARTVEDFGKASKFWNKLSNPDGSVNSAYGHLIWFDRSCGKPEFEQPDLSSDQAKDQCMRTPWEWARLALLTDKDTRQALLKFHKREHLWVGNKDVTCTLTGNFHIRNNKLYFGMRLRSQDVFFGMVFDISFFISLQERMLRELRDKKYPDLELGTYTHACDSLHLYERDLPTAMAMIGEGPEFF